MTHPFSEIIIAFLLMLTFTPLGSKLIDDYKKSKQARLYRKKDKAIMRKVRVAKKRRLKRKPYRSDKSDIHIAKNDYIQACSDELKL